MRKVKTMTWAGACAAALILASAGCGGVGGVGGTVSRGFLTFLERVTSGAVVAYVLKRADTDSGVVIQLNSYPDLGFENLLEGPSNTLFSVYPEGPNAKIVRLDAAGTTELGTVAGGLDLIASGPNGLVFVPNSSIATGQPIAIRSLPFTGGAATDSFSVNAGEPTEINGLSVSRADGSIFFAALFGAADGTAKRQIFKVDGTDVTQDFAAEFTGVIKGIAHRGSGATEAIFYLEETGGTVKLGKMNPADGVTETLQTFAASTSEGMTTDFDSDIIGFGIKTGGVVKFYELAGSTVRELNAPLAPTVSGAVFR
jgi:hypothetical protein